MMSIALFSIRVHSCAWWKRIATRSLSEHTVDVPRLEEVGVLEAPFAKGKIYQTGQCVLNKAFAYRGVVLMPWKANVIDNTHASGLRSVDYYQVLIDRRETGDRLVEALPREPWPRGRFLLNGLDHVIHDELLPYRPTGDCVPIKNVNTRRLFRRRMSDDAKLVPKVSVTEWRDQHYPWLNTGQLHVETTKGVLRVTTTCFYSGRHRLIHRWRCSVRIDNLSTSDTFVVHGHEWDVFSPSGRRHVVKGVSLPGNGLLLSPSERSVQHTFFLDIATPFALSWGFFFISKHPQTEMFRCKIPAFPLESVLRTGIPRDTP